MKKITFSLLAFFVIAVCSCLTSCSDKYDSVEAQCKAFIPNDVDFVINFDLSRIVDATDSKVGKDGVLELSEPIESLLRKVGGRDMRTFLENLAEFKGCAYKNVLIAVNYDKRKALAIMPLCDEDAFIKSLLDVSAFNFDKMPDVDGYKTVESHDMGVLVKDKLAFIAIRDDGPICGQKAVNFIDTWRESAADEHLDDWKIDYLARANATTILLDVNSWMSFAKSQSRGLKDLEISNLPAWTGIAFDVDKEQVKIAADYFKRDGSEFKANYLKKFDTSLLDYATAADIAVVGMGFDSDKLTNMFAEFMQIDHASESQIADFRNVMQMFKGQFMLSAGPIDGLNSFNRPTLDNWHFVLAAKADGNAIRSYLAKNLGTEFNADGSISIPTGGQFDWEQGVYVPTMTKFYTTASAELFVMSNAPISKNGGSKVDKSVFAGNSMAYWAAINRNNAMLENLNIPFGLMLTGQCHEDGNKAEMALKVTGTDKTLINAVVDAIIGNI